MERIRSVIVIFYPYYYMGKKVNIFCMDYESLKLITGPGVSVPPS